MCEAHKQIFPRKKNYWLMKKSGEGGAFFACCEKWGTSCPYSGMYSVEKVAQSADWLRAKEKTVWRESCLSEVSRAGSGREALSTKELFCRRIILVPPEENLLSFMLWFAFLRHSLCFTQFSPSMSSSVWESRESKVWNENIFAASRLLYFTLLQIFIPLKKLLQNILITVYRTLDWHSPLFIDCDP